MLTVYSRRRHGISLSGIAFVLLAATPLFAAFGSTETYLPAVGRVPGQGGAQFYTTVWATNLTTAPETFTFRFLKQGQANGAPASFQDTLQPGETKVYENVVESKLGLANAIGAARVTSTGQIFVSERIFNQAPGADLGDTEGLFFAGVPQSFSISAGQSASIQGINQGGSENFRYNFALVETGGGSPTVNVQVFDGSGTLLGQKAYPLQPYEQIQPGVGDIVAGIHTTNARVTATVTGGTGSVLLAGAQLANISQDSSGFEMTFRDELLGAGGGLTAVIHDGTLVGNGTSASPLGVNAGAVVTSLNGLHGGLTLSAGSNVTITPSGSTLTIASTGGGSGGLSLPFTGSSSTAATTFAVSNTGGGQAIEADSNATGFNVSANPFAIKGVSTGDTGTGVYGSTHGTSGEGGYTGVWGDSHDATAVQGTSVNDRGVLGITSSAASAGVEGLNRSSGGAGVLGIIGSGSGKSSTAGVWGDSDASGAGVSGTGNSAIGVYGKSTANWGIYGETGNATYAGTAGLNTGGGPGVYAESSSGSGIYAKSGSGIAGYFYSNSNGPALYVDNNNSSYVVAQFEGPIDVNGNVVTSGAGAVRLDDPRDPSNRSITHTFVGSSEMKNIYDGVAVLGASGTVTVVLPDWFDVLNRDFRYQLTALGTPQAGLFVSREIIGNSFTIAGGVPGARVSWQVTGVRKDRWAQDHPVAVIENKHVAVYPISPSMKPLGEGR